MNNKEIRALAPSKARMYVEQKHRWRAVWYGRVKHYFTLLSRPGYLKSTGHTLCGRDLSEYPRGDIKNDWLTRRCSTCERRYALLQQRAEEAIEEG